MHTIILGTMEFFIPKLSVFKCLNDNEPQPNDIDDFPSGLLTFY